MNYATYYINTGISCSANKRNHPRGEIFKHLGGESLHSNLEIVVGALLLLSPMFWLFIAELIK